MSHTSIDLYAGRSFSPLFLNRHWHQWRVCDLLDILHCYGLVPPSSLHKLTIVKMLHHTSSSTSDFPTSPTPVLAHYSELTLLQPLVRCANGTSWERASALVDSGSHCNVISTSIAKRLGFAISKSANDGSHNGICMNGEPLEMVGPSSICIRLTDSDGQTKLGTHSFYAANLQDLDKIGYAMILGQPWLASEDPQISFRTKQWTFSEARYGDGLTLPDDDEEDVEDDGL